MSRPIFLSVVIPVYNSAPLLAELYEDIRRELEGRAAYEIIFVDDCSSDGSPDELRRLARRDSRIRVAVLESNIGQQDATLCGISLSRGRYIANMDGDGQHPAGLLPVMLSRLRSRRLEIIYAVPSGGGREPVRAVGGIMRDLLFALLHPQNADVRVSSYRVMTRELARRVLRRREEFNYFSAMVFSCPVRAATLYYPYRRRLRGASGYSAVKRLLLYGRILLHYGPLKGFCPHTRRKHYPVKEMIGFEQAVDSGRL